MIKQIKFLLFIICTILSFAACKGGEMPKERATMTDIGGVPDAMWDKLANKRIYFGHQSVGYNTIDGMRDVIKDRHGIRLNIVETSAPPDNQISIFAHASIGRNGDPKSKIDDFVRSMEKGMGNKMDIAFFKFCYVDITSDTNVDSVFSIYKAALDHLKKVYPKTRFVHVTVPLTSKMGGIKVILKDMVKQVLGRTVRTYKDNQKRNEFNTRLMKEYQGKDPVFDLALIESTLPDGSRVSISENGVSYYLLAPSYTYDGGHLNESGRKIVAEQLLAFLATLPEMN